MQANFRKNIHAAVITTLVLLLSSCLLPGRPFDERKWREQVESADPALLYAPHRTDGMYFNPWMPQQKDFRDFLRWQLSGKASYSPAEENDIPGVAPDLRERRRAFFDELRAIIADMDRVHDIASEQFYQREAQLKQ